MSDETENKKRKSDANTCIGLGAGVGALGAGATLLTGLTCPICWVAAPALIGAGLIERRKCNKQAKENEETFKGKTSDPEQS